MASPIYSHPILELTLRTLSSNRLQNKNGVVYVSPDWDRNVPERCGTVSIPPILQNPFLHMQGLSILTDT